MSILIPGHAQYSCDHACIIIIIIATVATFSVLYLGIGVPQLQLVCI